MSPRRRPGPSLIVVMYYVYIVASKRNGTLYVGVTDDLVRRVWQHKEGLIKGFTSRYRCKLLVWFDSTDDVASAIQREKQIKEWKRRWKLRIIEETNPDWDDLYDSIVA
jgi:putative endonuclease